MCDCGRPVWREETVSEARDQFVETLIAGDEGALTVGAGRGRELLHPIELVGAPERERVRATFGKQRAEYLSHRDQTPSGRVDQSGVHPVARGEEAVLGEHLRGRHCRWGLSLELEARE